MMPHDFPRIAGVPLLSEMAMPWHLVANARDQIREKLRKKLGREEQSSIAIVDSQSVKTMEKKGRSTGLMVAKRLRT